MNGAAYAIDGRAVSREAFYAAACDPARSVIVEACAGAGKTWMLVSRVLRALLGGAQPQEILAITFTKKAAGEMRERLDEWLAGFAAAPEDLRQRELEARGLTPAQAARLSPELAALHDRVLRGGRMVEVRTFHAWFWQLLRVAPLELLAELDLQPEMELVEDPPEHQAEVYRRFHAAVAADAGLREDFDVLVRERGRTQVRRWLDAAWAKRVDIELADAAGTLEDSVPAPDPGGHPARRLHSGPWRAALGDLVAALERGGVRAQEAAQRLALALQEDDPASAFEWAWKALFTADKGTPRTQLGKPPGLVEAQAGIEALCQEVRQHESHVEHRRMVRLSRVLLAEYAAFKRLRGLADMSDLERGALALLRDSTQAGWVQERLDARVRHLLIDEFQDTSPLQWHALHAWLSGYAGAGGGASGQRPPGVFIVGDPKQSIYRFRGAEPRVFEAAREFVVEALGGSVLACDHTRRNAPEVLDALNAVFEAAEGEGAFGGFRPHTTEVARGGARAGVFALPRIARPAKAPRPETTEDEAPWRDSLTEPRHEPEQLLREQEARSVAGAVRELIGGGIPPGGIQVLCRKRESLRLLADALAAVHVPFAAAEDFALLEAPEAGDLIAVLDVLVSPQHRLSLAHALRSPIFGATDDDLIALARAGESHHDWWRGLRELPQPSPALLRARELLSRWRGAARQLPPHDLLDIVVAEGEVRERLVATVPAERRAAALAAVDALLHRALTLDGARYATPYNFVRALKRRSLTVPAALQPEAVQLLTVHGAKGLEAEVVFVMDADPEERPADTATVLVDWPVEADHPRRCAFLYSEKRCPPALVDVLERERVAREREEMNGLYVAMTRARARLVFSATEPRPTERVSWWARVQAWVREWQPGGAAGHAGAAPVAPPSTVAALPRLSRIASAAAPRPAAEDELASRLGQAVHRVLEWIAGEKERELAPLAAAAAREFAVGEQEVLRLAKLIWRSPASARFFRGKALRWAANEVPVADAGDALRIDRLVQLEEGGATAWWVLDYKLQHAPQALAAYREQLRRYRAAVQRLQPRETVRCAFITGQGDVVEVD
jgi:ATP-dependent helicase/nuclease subunit A